MKFKEIIDEQAVIAEEIELLPLCHTTTEGFFLNIYDSKTIKAEKQCPVYNEFLVYFFYGKPSYLVEKELENYTDDPPITLIYNVNDLKNHKIKRIVPFDSGGFSRYKIKRGYDLGNFTHDSPEIISLKGIIKLLYQNNECYLKDQVDIKEPEILAKKCWPIKEMEKLYKRVKLGEIKSGKQVYSIELQYAGEIEFSPKYLILPYTFFTSSFWSEEDFKKQFPDIIIDYYGQKEIAEANGNLEAFRYQQLMRDKVFDIIK